MNSQTSREQFDALIDLLATDSGDHENQDKDTKAVLRNPDGKLDFAKIRSFFTHRGVDETAYDQPLERGPSTASGFPKIIPDNLSPERALSRSIESSTTSVPALSSSLHTHNPFGNPNVEYDRAHSEEATSRDKVEHIVSHEDKHERFLPQDTNFERLGRSSRDALVTKLEGALVLSKGEIAALRNQVDDLHAMISGLFGRDAVSDYRARHVHEYPPETREQIRRSMDFRNYVPLKHHDALVEPHASAATPEQLDVLPLQEILPKHSRTISARLRDERPSHEQSGFRIVPASDPDDAQRAIDFVARVDDIVWRRSLYPTARGVPHAPILSESNLDALLQRIMLWEGIARGPSS